MTSRTWTPYQYLVDAEYERRRRRAPWLSAARGIAIGAVVGPSIVLGQWLLALAAVVVFVAWNGYLLTDFGMMRGFNADRRCAARKAGVCPKCLMPGLRHWTLAGCSREAGE